MNIWNAEQENGIWYVKRNGIAQALAANESIAHAMAKCMRYFEYTTPMDTKFNNTVIPFTRTR